jgi:hypothetical protein
MKIRRVVMKTCMTLTRAEVVAAHMAISIMWIEHKLEHDPEAEPLLSALLKFNTAVQAWGSENTAKQVYIDEEVTRTREHIAIDTVEALTAKAKVKMEVLVNWKCFCDSHAESCRFCQGTGQMKRWMPAKFLNYLKGSSFSVVALRKVGSWRKAPAPSKT